LRGFAALSVVAWHWHHFAPLLPAEHQLTVEQYPLYGLLSPFYRNARLAPDLFFVLSGFVFSWLYSDKVAEGLIGAKDFFVRRFARLYPLHVITLIVVAAGQWAIFRVSGTTYVFQANDIQHFVMHLLMAQDWLNGGPSFNGWTWSVSIEVLLYAIFFLLAKSGALRNIATPLIFVGLGVGLIICHWDDLARGFIGFFAGCITCTTYRIAINHTTLRTATLVLCTALVGWWACTRAPLPSPLPYFVFTLAFCPLAIASLALVETYKPAYFGRIGWLGELSYSSYLLHFPMQLLCAILVNLGILQATWLFTIPFFLIFYFALIVLSLVSYRLIERPSQDFILRRVRSKPVNELSTQRAS
jgi:peptidoglycan/LPS O-acetylase OafA/YrhL